jgi:hypothetical protein
LRVGVADLATAAVRADRRADGCAVVARALRERSTGM